MIRMVYNILNNGNNNNNSNIKNESENNIYE